MYVNGERNRILFEGEENFLDDENVEKIDLESTLESGSIVTQKVEKKENVESVKEEVQQNEIVSETQDSEAVDEIPEFTPETIIEEEKTESEKEEIQDETQTSFHEIEPIDSQIEKEEIKEEEIINEDLGDTGTVEETADFTPEKIINEDKISSEKEEKTVRDDSELSFHGMESFLPEVKIQANNTEEISKEIPQSNINKHEDEMRRLIEEVEKKMKEKAVSEVKKEEKEPENISHDISFSETQSFDVKPTETKAQEKEIESIQTEIEEPKDEIVEEIAKPIAEESTQVTSSWKPMSFESHVPDSMLNKTAEIPQPETETKAPKFEEIQPEKIKIEEPRVIEQETEVTSEEEIEKESVSEVQNEEDKTEEKDNVPVINVSFFGSDISKWTVAESKKEEENAKTAEKAEEVEKPIQKITPSILDSNVPGFINTWQSWLKINRVEEAPEKEKEEIKTKAIETFIETNPRISQLKDESSYVVKEKNDDISHLMTETLATLYFEQKLYTKAIKAFEILIKKTPEKKEYFEGKIQEIKDFRSKG
ncbi:hypothetical protein [Chryseobacterium sp. MMS23-Vi53]|uniref:hypothetical protein n=1 Tax=Chryseobacterium sp. MMS23-Vi53 TaxID=3386644 RepID=UPI0039EC4B0B